MFIEEEWFADMNLPDGKTFPTALIKRSKYIINQCFSFSRDKNQLMQEIAINNGWNTQIVQVLHQKCDGVFLKENF